MSQRLLFLGSDAFSSQVLARLPSRVHVTLASDQSRWLREHAEKESRLLDLRHPTWGVREGEFDAVLVCSFGKLVPPLPVAASFNVHPSLLPRWRGAAPAEWTVLAGDASAGVTLQTLAPRFDTGRLVWQKRFQLDARRVTAPDVLRLAAEHVGAGLEYALEDVEAAVGASTAQDESLVTLAPKLKRDAARVLWSEWTVEEVLRRHRALGHRFLLHAQLGRRMFQLKPCAIEEQQDDAEPGTLQSYGGKSKIRARAKDGWFGIDYVAREGGASSGDPKEFVNGYLKQPRVLRMT